MPTGAGLAVFYLKGKPDPVVFDLTHGFQPEFAKPFAPGSEVVPLIEVVVPSTGRGGRLGADRVEKIHRVIGIYSDVDLPSKDGTRPPKLPVMSECPEGMGEQYVKDAGAYPLVRKGETVVFDPARRDLAHGALCVIEWHGGTRDVVLTHFREVGGQGEPQWWVDPVNRVGAGTVYTSDGPYDADHLRQKLVGTVVGVLVPRREQDEPEPFEAAEPASDKTEADEAAAPDDADPVLAVIQAHAEARAAFVETCDATDKVWRQEQDLDTSDDAMAPAHAVWEAASHVETVAWNAVFETRPTTLAGIVAVIRHAQQWAPGNDGMIGAVDLRDILGSIAADVERLTLTGADDEVCSAEGAASLSFEAYDLDTPIRSPREWNERLSPYTVGLHLADRFLRMSKPELVAAIETLDGRGPEAVLSVLNAIHDTHEEMKALADIMGAAHTRLIVAGSSVIVSSDAKGV
ncbi:hypothetical protein AFCDBAGC_4320 [Methylobacterium cerastii]|uniref:Uncharacterized protein n=2 Tax=Methylobacterium cerastii TaxID=932741 RepID=A0ABQ4QML9_9HYPH|nr:hypothetical protein AFCDBAGC_4320 [Methylobacterium cerastii]